MRMLLLQREPTTLPAGPRQGVIEDARGRQRLRRRRAVTALLVGGLIAGLVWASRGAATRAHPGPGGAGAVVGRDTRAPAFNVRLVPMLDFVGVAGWCEVIEEHGVTGGGACGGVPTASQPFLQIYGSGESHSGEETQVAVTDPQITTILIDGRRRVATRSLPGLPYGLRGVRVVTALGATLTALDAQGVVPQHWSQTPRQATPRHWLYPHRPASGACQLEATGLPGLAVRGGAVARTIRPFPGQLLGHAFLPCAATEYSLRHEPLKAMVVLDAAQPGSRAADLPSFHAVRGAPEMFAGGSLTAMRSGNAWLVAEQGRGPSERMLLLRHLSAVVRTGR